MQISVHLDFPCYSCLNLWGLRNFVEDFPQLVPRFQHFIAGILSESPKDELLDFRV